MSDENNKKDIEVVEGNGNLDISPVYEHLSGSKPKMQNEKPKNIVIPQVKKPINKEEIKEDSDDDEDFLSDLDDLEDIFTDDEDDDSDSTDDIDEIDD